MKRRANRTPVHNIKSLEQRGKSSLKRDKKEIEARKICRIKAKRTENNLDESFQKADEAKLKLARNIFGVFIILTIVFMYCIYISHICKGQDSVLKVAPILLFMGWIAYIFYDTFKSLCNHFRQ